MKYEMKLTISGMKAEDVRKLYEILDDNMYAYVGTEEQYVEITDEIRAMKMCDYIRQLDECEMQRFIYWVYSCGNYDGFRGCEDSPGKCSFFGGAMLDRTVGDVLDGLETSYGFDWL